LEDLFTVKRFTSIAALAAFALAAAACGSDGSSSAATTPVTTASPGTTAATATIAAPTTTAADSPKAIISLSPSATEMLFAIGAGSQVIAVDDQSNYPAEALDKPHTLSGFEPNVEAIAALKPDLVVMSDPKVQPQLEKLGITVWIGAAPTDFSGVYDQIEQLGAAAGHVADAASLVAKMQTDIDTAVKSVPKAASPLSVYHELDPTFYSVTSNTFIGKVFAQFGLANIADGAQPGNDYPQLNAEYIVKADPSLIVLADTKCCAADKASVAARPGWGALTAVKNNGVISVDDDIASRWGPRVVDFVQAVAAALAKVPAGA
jgi:iron complex transport system substrate-binding protein